MFPEKLPWEYNLYLRKRKIMPHRSNPLCTRARISRGISSRVTTDGPSDSDGIFLFRECGTDPADECRLAATLVCRNAARLSIALA
jgi:hypothetical protein